MPTPENRAVARWSDALTSEGLGGGAKLFESMAYYISLESSGVALSRM